MRTNLEKSFNVDYFLKYLTINNTIVNWKSYRALAHNYYLFTPLMNGRVTWLPWDFNLSMPKTTTIGAGNTGMRGMSLEISEVGVNWPMTPHIYPSTKRM